MRPYEYVKYLHVRDTARRQRPQQLMKSRHPWFRRLLLDGSRHT